MAVYKRGRVWWYRFTWNGKPIQESTKQAISVWPSLRRMLKLAVEWSKVDKLLPRVEMLPGENQHERVLTADEEAKYLEAAAPVGQSILGANQHALDGIRASQRGEEPIVSEPRDPFLLRDTTTILIDCGLRPEDCFRLRWDHVQDGGPHPVRQKPKTLGARSR